jgi:hypothetical protein
VNFRREVAALRKLMASSAPPMDYAAILKAARLRHQARDAVVAEMQAIVDAAGGDMGAFKKELQALRKLAREKLSTSRTWVKWVGDDGITNWTNWSGNGVPATNYGGAPITDHLTIVSTFAPPEIGRDDVVLAIRNPYGRASRRRWVPPLRSRAVATRTVPA